MERLNEKKRKILKRFFWLKFVEIIIIAGISGYIVLTGIWSGNTFEECKVTWELNERACTKSDYWNFVIARGMGISMLTAFGIMIMWFFIRINWEKAKKQIEREESERKQK